MNELAKKIELVQKLKIYNAVYPLSVDAHGADYAVHCM